jgi:hypothetical protein
MGKLSRTPKQAIRPRISPIAFALAVTGLGTALTAQAGEFVLDNGVEGRWSLNASIGTSVRTGSADENLIMTGNGGKSGSSHDDGNLNFDRGDRFSTIFKAIGELQLKKDNIGVFARIKTWYDFELEDNGVRRGSSANGYRPGARLNDDDFDPLSRFSGVSLADAYIFANTNLGESKPLTVKLGNHVVNWGESLFIAGINQYGAFDVSAARRPGAQVKEILLPIPQLSASLGLTDNLSVEGFYQFNWKKNILDGCGTYWSISDVYNCSNQGVVIGAGPLAARTDQVLYGPTAGLFGSATNAILGNASNIEPGNSGQYGLAMRYFAPEIATEFGAYFANYHQRSPVISVLFNRTNVPGSVFGGTPGAFQLQYAWDWSAEDIKVYGLSFSTGIAGWSVFGEMSHTQNIPVQLNGLDLLRGATSGAGPLMADPSFVNGRNNRNTGILYHGYDLKDKNQFQISTLKSFPRVLGAESMTFIGEVAYQHWSGIGDPSSGRRYGRAFVFGQAVSSVPGQAATTCAGTGNANTDYCENEGFATTNAWGYRMQAELSYPDVFAGVNVKPRVFWSHDVKGYSADSTFLENRMILGLGARFDYLNKYYADFSYNRFNDKAKYDVFHDRDFFSAVVGINF